MWGYTTKRAAVPCSEVDHGIHHSGCPIVEYASRQSLLQQGHAACFRVTRTAGNPVQVDA